MFEGSSAAGTGSVEMFRIFILLVVLSTLPGCSELQVMREDVLASGNSLATVIEGKRGVNAWLADLNSLGAQPAEDMPTVLAEREAAFSKKPDIENRMRLVLVLIVDDEDVRDERRARQLLRRLDPLPAETGDREFVLLLQQFLVGNAQYEQKLSVLWKQVTQQNRRIDELEQQLKALTSIEQNIQQREPPQVKEDGK